MFPLDALEARAGIGTIGRSNEAGFAQIVFRFEVLDFGFVGPINAANRSVEGLVSDSLPLTDMERDSHAEHHIALCSFFYSIIDNIMIRSHFLLLRESEIL